MRHLIVTLLFFLIAASLMADDSGKTFNLDPNATVIESWCAYDTYIVSGIPVNVPAVGVGVAFQSLPVIGSGGHQHEGFPGGSARPPAKFRQFTAGDGAQIQHNFGTGASYALVRTYVDGCAYVYLDFPGFSGQYDVEGYAQGYGQGTIHDFASIAGLEAYPENPAFNYSQIPHADAKHPDGTFFVNSQVKGRLQSASILYQTLMLAAGVIDKVDFIRASTKYGGDADNDYILTSGTWYTRIWEEHYKGMEIDAQNPYIARTGNVTLLQSVMARSGCTFGKMKPGGFETADDLYWQASPVIHFSCSTSRLPVRRF